MESDRNPFDSNVHTPNLKRESQVAGIWGNQELALQKIRSHQNTFSREVTYFDFHFKESLAVG